MNWIKRLFTRGRIYGDLSQEISEHIEEKVDELVANGMSRADAVTVARREFGNVALVEEHGRTVWQWTTLEYILRDARFAVRQLRRNPGFTFTVILTLSVAIGANTAVFSVVNALLLRPLPYPQPDRLASLVTHYDSNKGGQAVSDDDNSQDGETWDLVRGNVPAVVAGAWSGAKGVNLQTGANARYVQEQRVSARYFEALGVQFMFGRGFAAEEDRPNGAKAVVLSYELWQSLFSSDSAVLGKTISLKGEPYTVIGVLPAHAETTSRADLWTPLRPSRSGEGSGNNYGIILRLREDATWAQANAQLAPLRPEMLDDFEKRRPQGHAWLYALPLQRDLAREQITPVFILMSAVAFILLIACANLAGLMLVRVMRRSGEIATRLALGATPGSILRQLMMEPLILTLAGGAAGVAVAVKALDFFANLLPRDLLPFGGLSLDGRVLGFAIAVSFCASILIGALPALELRKMNIRLSMATSASRSGIYGGNRRTRQALIAGEVALTVVLLASAGLLVHTLIYLEALPPGFDANNVLTAKVSLDDARYHDAGAFHRLLRQSVGAMRRIPGVESAAVGLSLPFERGLNDGFKIADGAEAGNQAMSSSSYVTADYFGALRIPLLSGRTFAESDTPDSQPVAIVNASFARKFLGTIDVVGRHIKSGKITYEIVGVVADVTKRPGLEASAPLTTEATYYVPATQMGQAGMTLIHIWFQPSWIVRTKGPINGLSSAMQAALAEADPALPFAGFHSLKDLEANALRQQRLEALLLGVMAGLALLLSLVGVYGLVSNLVVQRTREIGIRMALGSSVGRAMVEIGKSGITAIACGVAGGLILAGLTLQVLKSQLYGVRTYDPATLIAVVALLGISAAAATFIPTRRIARIDPALTLRSE